MKRLLAIVVLAIVFGGSAGVVMYLALRGRTVEVPNLIGKSRVEAERQLDQSGLRLKIISGDLKIPTLVVSDQSPAAGTTVKTGQQVRVSLIQGTSSPTS
ncbi:MAG TPA: PASTA domain-containing protein [Blastocatellia bacterium]|nr:PASTA domain-containing protein [Blastocatellia bacterium]